MRYFFLLPALLAIALSGCQLGTQFLTNDAGEKPGLEVKRIAKVTVSQGTSKVLGTVRLPSSLLGSGTSLDQQRFVAGARLELLDRHGQPISGTSVATSDEGGVFSFPTAPLGVSMVLRAQVAVGGKTLVLKKLLRPSEALTCAHVDLATTAIADKLFSGHPLLLADPGLDGADLFELFNSTRLLDAESLLRSQISQAPPPTIQEVQDALAAGNTASIFDVLAPAIPGFTTAYQALFDRPDSSLGFHITAVGTNSIGTLDRTKVFGVITFKVVHVPEEIVRVEYWAKSDKQIKVAEATASPDFEATLDTWTLKDDEYTFDTIAVTDKNRRRLLGQTFVTIENTIGNHCPLP